MKKIIFLSIVLMVGLIIPVSAQETTETPATNWVILYQSDFSNPVQSDWSTGTVINGSTTITRTVVDSGYRWNISTPDGQFSWLSIPTVTTTPGNQIAVSAAIQLPAYSPYACAGLLFGEQSESFYTFLICNDSTYGLYQYQNGTWNQAIPFSALKSFEQGQPITVRAEISNGWADFYAAGTLLDTYNISYQQGAFGIYAQPLSIDSTDFIFNQIQVEEAPAKAQETVFAENVPDSMTRIIKMLELKERITGTGGSFLALEDRELSLAQMGYYSKADLGITGQDYILQSDISWKSAYEKPDYINSGCGFIFRSEDEYTFQRVYIALDGNIYLSAFRNGTEIPIMTYNYGTWSLEGEGTLTLVADEAKISVLYNENLLGTVYNATWMATGSAGLVVQSGTNYDYGTACTFKNSQAYIFE
ncbi:MAG: hypothetical protein AB9907_16210 [Flexilinea sp.]